MRTLGGLSLILMAALAACHPQTPKHVSGGALGRVVIYRNGVAFYERNAKVADGRLVVQVPRDKVDDFLKSLTVVDRVTKRKLAISIPRKEADDGSYLTMTLETPERQHADVQITYVTDAPAWKPSYRVVVGTNDKVMLEGWAVVDNTTSEDWKGVLVGVGASSALAFRYDLWSVRHIDRDLLAGEERFAIAPPTGVSPYAETSGAGGEELASLDANEVRKDAEGGKATPAGPSPTPVATTASIQGRLVDAKTNEAMPGVTIVASGPAVASAQTAISDDNGSYKIDLPPGTYTVQFYYADITVERANVVVAANKTSPVYAKLDTTRSRGEVVKISDAAPTIDPTSVTQGVTIDKNYVKRIPVPGRTFESAVGAAAGSAGDAYSGSTSVENQYYVDGVNTTGSSGGGDRPAPPPPVKVGDDKLKATVAKVLKDKKDVVVEVHGYPGGEQAAIARGQAVKNKLVDDGVPANRVHVVSRIGPGEGERVRVLAIAPGAQPQSVAPKPIAHVSDAPVGESHFENEHPMTVKSGSSAMVAMVQAETSGGVVYLYDPLSDRGDKRFAFKAVRLENPTEHTLEPGPVTVYGNERFIGEGITEPVPPKSTAVIPFALDKQIIVEQSGAEDDKIARLVTVQRGVVTAEIQHRRTTTFKITSRLAASSKVYLRHHLHDGWALVDEPPPFTKVGDSHLFEVTLAAHETREVVLAEATPVERTFDLSNPTVLGMMQLWLEEPDGASETLKTQLTALLVTHHDAIDLVDKIATLRDQLGEYRQRSGELNAQIVTLKAVRSGGELMASLRHKMGEMSDRIQKTTIAIVDTQEQLMLARVKFQNQLSELHLDDTTRSKAVPSPRRISKLPPS